MLSHLLISVCFNSVLNKRSYERGATTRQQTTASMQSKATEYMRCYNHIQPATYSTCNVAITYNVQQSICNVTITHNLQHHTCNLAITNNVQDGICNIAITCNVQQSICNIAITMCNIVHATLQSQCATRYMQRCNHNHMQHASLSRKQTCTCGQKPSNTWSHRPIRAFSNNSSDVTKSSCKARNAQVTDSSKPSYYALKLGGGFVCFF